MTIFSKQQAVASFRKRFGGVAQLQPLCSVDDAEIYRKLLAAENTVAQRLRVLLETTIVFCADNDNTAAIAALPDGTAYIEEPGYDYDAEYFYGNSWGRLQTRSVPIQSVQRYAFQFVDPKIALFVVPLSWIRMDKKYGQLSLLPTGEASTLPLNAYLLSVYAGGRTIPNMIRLNYTAGIKDINAEYPGLVDFIYRVAALLSLLDTFPSNSDSISMDGLSQSTGFDISAYIDGTKGAIEREYKSWMDILHGVRIVIA